MRPIAAMVVAVVLPGALVSCDGCSGKPSGGGIRSVPASSHGVSSVTMRFTVEPDGVGLTRLKIPISFPGGQGGAYVMLDTGSGGTRLLAERVPEGLARRTGKRGTVTYGGGTMYDAEQASLAFRLGTPEAGIDFDVPVDLLENARCAPSKPHCHNEHGTGYMTDHGFIGLIGIGLRGKGRVYNPLEQLGGALGEGFMLSRHDGKLVVGLTADAVRGFHRFKLEPLGERHPNGMPLLKDNALPVCFSVPGTAYQNDCASTMFDSGYGHDYFVHPPMPPEMVEGGYMRAGVELHAELPGVFSWTTRVGEKDVIVDDHPVLDSFDRILGIDFFTDHDVLYDLRSGEIGVRTR